MIDSFDAVGPDDILAFQKYQLGHIFVGLGMKNVGLLYYHF
jgi:hypothetical protein